ncbi:hypothetical protein SPOG_05508 [Schizosaccharomyces cryophilus OY26]|uniref:Uncharacterized protein n=1 Tax=Schizosaccharomyces cryophilus (strain OY26 / ATCC MYA-4695 / CBS 11777 / NBRC 106824 / NRRL Y48691) TaxID=653667 RepID=S9XHS4_SCHCR|nr:uncharacterized protein SPOG_05508 [Schizosaccharomyces cryophilus OY26]EPY53231.1 hypothetical protein SPOG_05508 [Schizosaccharomyces cryophilus OY26]
MCREYILCLSLVLLSSFPLGYLYYGIHYEQGTRFGILFSLSILESIEMLAVSAIIALLFLRYIKPISSFMEELRKSVEMKKTAPSLKSCIIAYLIYTFLKAMRSEVTKMVGQ